MENKGQRIHFIGIGGTAMAGTALIARELGFNVTGSDQKVYPPTSDLLKAQGIAYNENYHAENLANFSGAIVLGNAISRGNAELEAALNLRLKILSLPEFIGSYVIGHRKCLAIAGTHGKTTTSSLVAHILRANGIDTGFMIGGVPNNFSRSAELGRADVFVIEADEYDTSIFDHRSKFLSYRPTHAIINNIEFDHADIFSDLAEVEKAFSRLIKIIPGNGMLVINTDNASCQQLVKAAYSRVITFGENALADYRLKSAGETLHFQRRGMNLALSNPLAGKHNALNILAAMAIVEDFNIPDAGLFAAIATFTGVKRRLETKVETDDYTVIEDFAHHPTAIAANLEALRQMYGTRRLVVLVEPRSNTMVRKFFQTSLATTLATADVVFLDAIYRPEKYPATDRLDLEELAKNLSDKGKLAYLLPSELKVDFVLSRLKQGDVICFMTNGSFGGLIAETVNRLSQT